jgi:hypothetical protein
MYFLHKYEYGAVKPIENTIRRAMEKEGEQ